MATKKVTEEQNEQEVVVAEKSMKNLNIYERMSAITQEINAVAKNLNVGFGKSQYKAVGEADVLAAVKPIEAKYGVYSYPLERNIIETAILENTKSDGSVSKAQFMRVATTYRFVNMEVPTEYIDMVSYGDGVDTQDKAPGKAMTYSDKYSLLKAYKIITGDDPDQNMSQEYTSINKKPALQKEAPKVQPTTPYPSRDEMIKECKEHYIGDNLDRLLNFYKVDSVDALSSEQLMVAYNTAMKGKSKLT